jgi:hypothetical protein
MMTGFCSDPLGPAEGAGRGAVARAPGGGAPAGALVGAPAGPTAEGPAGAPVGPRAGVTAGARPSLMIIGSVLVPDIVNDCFVGDKRKHFLFLQSYIH